MYESLSTHSPTPGPAFARRYFFRWKYKVIIFLLLLPATTFAQFQVPFINYTTDNGLLQNQVTSICQDAKGYIWFATAEGISRFDGKSFRNFTVADGLPARMVTAIMADSHNRIWVATLGGGLAMYDGHSFHTYSAKDGLASNNISAADISPLLLEDTQGNIWCRTPEGVSMIGNKGIKTYQNAELSGMVTCMAIDPQGRVICGNDKSVSIIDQGQIVQHKLGNDFGAVMGITVDKGILWVVGANHRIARMYGDQTTEFDAGTGQFVTHCLDSQNKLWLATVQDGVSWFANGRFVHFEEFNGLVFRIFEDQNLNTWLLTPDNGVYKYDNHSLHHYHESSGLVGNQTRCIFEDIEGNIWIGTDNGVSMYGKVIFETLTTTSGLPNNHVVAVAAADDGSIWCSPHGSGLARITGKDIHLYEYRYKDWTPRANFIISMAPTKDGLLLGTFEEGLGEFQKGTINFRDNRIKTDVNDILVAGDDDWLATSKGLIHLRDGKSVRSYTSKDGLPDDLVIFLARDSCNRIWCTTPMGLSVFDGERFTTYTTADGLPNNSCTDIAVDKYGTIWVGTNDGLCRITETDRKPVFKTYTQGDGLASGSISLVHADRSDRLWVGHVNGLNMIDLKTDSIRYYAREDGYLPMDCYQGAAVTDTAGHVWFGTVAGLVRYSPGADVRRTTPPRTYITGISLSGGEDILQHADSISTLTGLPVNLSLPHDKNLILLNWIGIHYTIPSKNRYRYILEGYDKAWHEASAETSREYQLSPGRYTFRVMACNNDGVWNDAPVSYSFVVRQPWWATVAAYIAYALILGVFIYIYIRWRERSLKEKNRILEDRVYERTLEIELQKQNILAINKDLKEYQEELIAQRDLAAEQRDQIDEQKKEILDSIHYAKRIQNAIMPKPEELKEIIPGFFLMFRPRDVVSGDYYWAVKKDGKSVVVAADCTGHGVPGAFMSMLGISILNEIVLKQQLSSASQILDELRYYLKMLLSQTGAAGEQRDGMDAVLCLIDYQAMEVQYAGAYNPLYMIRNNILTEYKANKMPVGIHIGEEKPFTNHVIRLEHGDMLYIFSDGYVDQFGGPDNTKFKSKPFKKLLADIASLPVEQQKETLLYIHDQWKGNYQQIDDILVMGIRID